MPASNETFMNKNIQKHETTLRKCIYVLYKEDVEVNGDNEEEDMSCLGCSLLRRSRSSSVGEVIRRPSGDVGIVKSGRLVKIHWDL